MSARRNPPCKWSVPGGAAAMGGMMDEIEWWEFDSLSELAEQAAGDIGFVIDSAVEAHGSARIAVSTGAEPVLRALVASQVDWSKVTVMPTHDRLVPLS